MTKLLTIIAASVALAAGFLAALSLAPAAFAWSPSDLPPGWYTEHIVGLHTSTCTESYRIWTSDRGVFSDPFCTDSPSYQADFDGWVNAHYTPPPSSTTTASSTVTVTTTAATTTAPAVSSSTTTTTTTTPVTSAPSTTTTPPADPTTTTTTAAAATTTTAATTTVALTRVEQALSDRIDVLAAQIGALTDRVARLEKAGDAAWLAYNQALAAGSDPATAATTARSTYLNAVYGLGAFAP